MASRNPFKDIVRMKAPEGKGGGTVSVEGFELDHDEEDCVEVPARHRSTLEAHGYTPVPDKSEPVKVDEKYKAKK